MTKGYSTVEFIVRVIQVREIKFRAKTLKGRKTIYGYYLPFFPMSSFEKVPCIVDDEGYFYAIDKCTLQQFCGYDVNGEEVYEDDIVIVHGKEYKVKIDFCYGAFHNLKRCRKK